MIFDSTMTRALTLRNDMAISANMLTFAPVNQACSHRLKYFTKTMKNTSRTRPESMTPTAIAILSMAERCSKEEKCEQMSSFDSESYSTGRCNQLQIRPWPVRLLRRVSPECWRNTTLRQSPTRARQSPKDGNRQIASDLRRGAASSPALARRLHLMKVSRTPAHSNALEILGTSAMLRPLASWNRT